MCKESEYLNIVLQLKDWHDKKIASLQQLVDADEKTKFIVESSEGNQIELPEKHRKGFELGIRLAIETLGSFPVEIKKTNNDECK